MGNILDYVSWRGDLPFTQYGPNEVDALIFSALSYIPFRGKVLDSPEQSVDLREAAEEFFASPEPIGYVRPEFDLALLRSAAQSRRFGGVKLTGYREVLNKERDTQFAAVTFQLDDGSLYVSFRGTDNTLVGWKEDFSMCFRQEIPSQKLAKQYLQEILMTHKGPVRVSGHSKGGNVAVYAVSQLPPVLRERIIRVYNQDGPGFPEDFLENPGYRSILPILVTQVPQGSVIGMILHHLEPMNVIKSSGSGIMQHDAFTWEVLGTELLREEKLSENAVFLQLTIETWLKDTDVDTRVRMVNMLFELLTTGDAEVTGDLFLPKNLVAYISRLRTSEILRKYLAEDLSSLFRAAKKARLQLGKGGKKDTKGLPNKESVEQLNQIHKEPM